MGNWAHALLLSTVLSSIHAHFIGLNEVDIGLKMQLTCVVVLLEILQYCNTNLQFHSRCNHAWVLNDVAGPRFQQNLKLHHLSKIKCESICKCVHCTVFSILCSGVHSAHSEAIPPCPFVCTPAERGALPNRIRDTVCPHSTVGPYLLLGPGTD